MHVHRTRTKHTHASAPRYPHIRSRQHKLQPSSSKAPVIITTTTATLALLLPFSQQGKLKYACPQGENQLRRRTVQAVARSNETPPWEDDRAWPRLLTLTGATRDPEDAEYGAARKTGLDVGGAVQGIENSGVFPSVLVVVVRFWENAGGRRGGGYGLVRACCVRFSLMYDYDVCVLDDG